MDTNDPQVENQKIDDRLKSIESKIDHILPEVENVLAQRVYEAARDKLSSSAKYVSIFIALLIGAIGYQSYKEIVDIGGTKVAEAITESIIPELQKSVQAQVDSRLEELMVEARAKANAKVDQKIAEVSAIYQEKFNNLLKEIKTKKPRDIDVSISSPKINGYALYGEGKKDEDGKWIWARKNFILEGNHPERFPKENQSAISENAVLVRDIAPSVRYETREIKTKIPVMKGLEVTFKNKVIAKTTIPILEESTSKPVGTISKGKKIYIESIKIVLDKFVWVKVNEQ